MEIAKLQAGTRVAAGTKASRRLRREGMLPGIVYGHGQDTENVTVPAHDMKGLLDHGTHVVELDLNGSPHQVLIKAVQFDYLDESPIHVDFARVDLTERVTVSVPLDFRGIPVGTHEGGSFDHALVDLEIECQVVEIPESIRVNVGDMHVGDFLHVRDVELPPNITAVTPEEAIVCSVRAKLTAETDEEAGAVTEEGEAQQPEIIGRKEKQEEGNEKSEGR